MWGCEWWASLLSLTLRLSQTVWTPVCWLLSPSVVVCSFLLPRAAWQPQGCSDTRKQWALRDVGVVLGALGLPLEDGSQDPLHLGEGTCEAGSEPSWGSPSQGAPPRSGASVPTLQRLTAAP